MEKPVNLAAVRMFVRASLNLGRYTSDIFDSLTRAEREALLRHAVMPRPRPPRQPKPVDPAEVFAAPRSFAEVSKLIDHE